MHLAYFPDIATLRAYCRSSDKVHFDLDERYVRQTTRNRCIISTANGPLKLSIPVMRPSGGSSLTSEILIDDSKKWRMDHWRSIQAAYRHAPYFDHYESTIESLIFGHQKRLVDVNLSIVKFLFEHLFMGDFHKINPNNYEFSPREEIQQQTIKELNYKQVFATEENTPLDSLSFLDGLFNIGPLLRNHL